MTSSAKTIARKVGLNTSAPGCLVLASALLVAGCTLAPPRAEYAFALLGNSPQTEQQVELFSAVVRELNAEPLAFVAHVGGIVAEGRCDDESLDARKRQLQRIRQPFVLLPGGGDWLACRVAGHDPLERLRKWRSLFCDKVPELGLERQSEQSARYPEFCEHVRWRVGDVLYVGLNVPGRDAESVAGEEPETSRARRLEAARDWLEAAVAVAEANRLTGLVVLAYGDLLVDERQPGPRRADDASHTPSSLLRQEASRGRRPLLLVYGEAAVIREDEPIRGLRRLAIGADRRWMRAHAVQGGFVIADRP